MRLIASSLVLLALAACSKPLHGPILEGPVTGLISRGEALPAKFASEVLDLKNRRNAELRTADFDLDGAADLLVHPRASAPQICWNDGQGSFGATTLLDELGQSNTVRIADFNGDGYPDLAAVDSSQGIRILLNDGHASFEPARQVQNPDGHIRHIAAADWNGSPGAELIWVSEKPYETRCGGFQAGEWTVKTLAKDWHTGFFYGLEVTDVNADGRSDLVLIGSNTILLQQEDGTLQDASLDDPRWRIMAAGQLDDTAGGEVLVQSDGEPLAILSRSASGGWTELGTFPLYGFQATAQLIDLDADGRTDLCVHQNGFYSFGCFGGQEGWASPSSWQVLLRRADGWQLRESKPVDDYIHYPGVIAQFDANLYPDLVVHEAKVNDFRLVRDPFRP